MLKRSLIVILALLSVFSFADDAFAAGTPEQYTADASVNYAPCKGTITVAATKPGRALGANGYNGEKEFAEAATVSSSFAKKAARLLPVTESPIILDSGRAILLGAPPEECGAGQKEHGFYIGTSRHDLKIKIKSNKIIRGKTNKLVTGLEPETVYYCRAYTVTSRGTVYGDKMCFITPPEKKLTAQDAVFGNPSRRYMYLFGSTDKYYRLKSPPFGYVGKAEASKQMVTVKVPVWNIKRGKKVSVVMPVTINYKLENNVKAIFEEIHKLNIKFPVMDLKGYSYRRISGPGLEGSTIMSHHSFGAAIDVNKPYNQFYRHKDKRNRKNPYYIPQSVIDIFEKYGWAWGGDFKEGLDTMHFQYLGLDLTKTN